MNEIVKRKSIEDIYKIKLTMLSQLESLQKLDKEISEAFRDLNGYEPVRIDYRYDNHGENREEKYIDRTCWKYLIRLFELEKYMLCTDYEKVCKQIDDFNFPVFTIDNAEGWIASLKDIIYDNVRTMMKSVYERITEGHYYTGGSSYSTRAKKKRNNNGIDKHFIMTTHDWSRVFGYSYSRLTVTDDLEKLCYILNGKKLPEKTIIRTLERYGKNDTAENEFFKIKLCKNGNTHYWIEENTRNKLNLYGADPSKIGENLRIKVFDKDY